MEKKNPWQCLGTKEIYQNPWIRVREDQVIRPDGSPGIYGVIEFPGSVGVLPIDAEGNVHLVGQYRYTLDRYSWEIVEGGSHTGETPIQAAQRELKEELGIQAANYELLMVSHLSNSVSDEEAHIFLATGLTLGESIPDETEQLEHRIAGFEEVMAMIKSGEITDSMTQIAILHYAVVKLCP